MAPIEVHPDRLLAKIGALVIELEMLREQIAELEARLAQHESN